MEREPTPYELDDSVLKGIETPNDRYDADPLDFFHPVDDLDIPGEKTPFELVVDTDKGSYVKNIVTDRKAFQIVELRAFDKYFELDPDLVYYPGSRMDLTPSIAFPDAQVVYNDIDSYWVDELQQNGFQAVEADATELEFEEEFGRPDIIYNYDTGIDNFELIEVAGAPSTNLVSMGFTPSMKDFLEPMASATRSRDGYLELFDDRPGRVVLSKAR